MQEGLRLAVPAQRVERHRVVHGIGIANPAALIRFVTVEDSLQILGFYGAPTQPHLLGRELEPRPGQFVRRRGFGPVVKIIRPLPVLHRGHVEQRALQKQMPGTIIRGQLLLLHQRRLRARDVIFSQLKRRQTRPQMPRRTARRRRISQCFLRVVRPGGLDQRRGEPKRECCPVCIRLGEDALIEPNRHRRQPQLLGAARRRNQHRGGAGRSLRPRHEQRHGRIQGLRLLGEAEPRHEEQPPHPNPGRRAPVERRTATHARRV